ncbi:MAG: fructose bisphosphate aldolase [Deltaproteobacteria bacterium]|nr:fructose bisphosphate aldolase [Deltaproteobacteria bacterium]
MSFDQQFEIVKIREGFIAALDQSGGSTPKALRLYGIGESEYSGEEQMFDRIHEMRSRIVTSPSFTSNRILGAILFEQTMRRQIEGQGSAQYLWEQKQVVPFLKVDQGLAEENDGVQLMKPMPGLDELLQEAGKHQVFGTKMRSVIKTASLSGVKAVVDQQFEIGKRIVAAGLVPILEPEVDINSATKGEAEQMLLELLMENINGLATGQNIMLKLSLPNLDDHYAPCVQHPNVVRVVALSGGYSRDDANAKLTRNQGMTASFSRALTEGISSGQSDEQFNNTLDSTIESIFQASIT